MLARIVKSIAFLSACSAILFVTAQLDAAEEKKKSKSSKPKIAFIIDDIGHKKREAEIIAKLNAPLTLAVLPYTPHGTQLAELGHKQGKEIMLHLPMQPATEQRLVTKHTLSINMMQDEFVETVEKALADVPHIQGVNNHMGSLFTQLPQQMSWLMQTMNANDNSLFFIDSFTSERSIAFEVATKHSIANAKRDVFLDRQLDAPHMNEQIKKLKRIAKRNGHAIAIGHPFKETVSLLKRHIPELEREGFELVTVSELLKETNNTSKPKQLAQNQKEITTIGSSSSEPALQ